MPEYENNHSEINSQNRLFYKKVSFSKELVDPEKEDNEDLEDQVFDDANDIAEREAKKQAALLAEEQAKASSLAQEQAKLGPQVQGQNASPRVAAHQENAAVRLLSQDVDITPSNIVNG